MNPILRILILFMTDLFLFKFFGFWIGLIGMVIVVFRVLSILGITRYPSFYKANFADGVAFLKDYQGPLSKNKTAFQEALNLIKSFNLKDYVIIGIYFDKPGEVEKEKMRYSIGIFKKNKGFPEKPSKELERYCNSKNYNYVELPEASSLFSSWEYSNFFSMMIGIEKFNSSLKKNLQDDDFKRTYRIKDGSCKVIIELYETDSMIHFYIPLLNADKFLVYKKDK